MNAETKQLLETKLKNLKIENADITDIEFKEAGEKWYSVDGILMRPLPPRCNVNLLIKPTEESFIRVVVSLPSDNWNGKFLGTGNGGAAGSIVMQSVNAGVSRGFATANTDMGTSLDFGDMFGKKERLIDFGHRATHLMGVAAKEVIKAFYGKAPEYSYFVGGSTGGQQSLMEAQRYPEDYDGIVAFSPAYNRVNLHQAFVWDLLSTCDNPEKLFSVELAHKVHETVLKKFVKKCGGAEGDNFISYPGKAHFSPDDVEDTFKELNLTEAQKDVLRKVYSFPNIPGTNDKIYVPQPIGCEVALLTLPYIKDGFYALLGFLQRWAFGDKFDYTKYDFSSDYLKMVDMLRGDLDATSPDLSAFKAHGGKLILITGSTDCLIPYTDGKNYYESAVKANGGLENTTDFFRYFHVPGLGHCSGGQGLQEVGSNIALASVPLDSEHDALEALIEWREKGKAPEMLLPVGFKDEDMKNEVDMERPVYPYPYETEYIGGDRKKKESFRKKLGDGNY